jgi:hypothetical protein
MMAASRHLAFFRAKKSRCRHIFRALSNAFYRLSIGRRKVAVSKTIILPVFSMGTKWKVVW